MTILKNKLIFDFIITYLAGSSIKVATTESSHVTPPQTCYHNNCFEFAHNMAEMNFSPLPSLTRRTIPLPPVGDDYPPILVSITPLLRYSPEPQLHFDLRCPPSSVTLTDHRYHLEWYAPATNPPVPHMWIVCTRLPRFLVRASQEYVTIYDLISALHYELCLIASAGDLNSLHQHDRNLVTASYTSRINFVTDYGMQMQMGTYGLKKYDFLLGRARFAGLSKMGNECDVFFLNVI
jgi:hypothetical protein